MNYNKAIIAVIGAIVAVLAAFGVALPWFTPEVQSGISAAITAILVYAIPNKPSA
jgi:hypothetical protein